MRATLCGNCDYWYEGVCCNGDADERGEFVDSKFGCKCHAPAQPRPAFKCRTTDHRLVASCPRCEAALTYDAEQMDKPGGGVCVVCGNAYTYPARWWPGV